MPKALELCGASRLRSDWLSPVSEAWAGLLAQAPDQRDAWTLTQFAQYCNALGVVPTGVENAHVKRLSLPCQAHPEKLKAGLRWYMNRFDSRPTGSTHKLVACVKSIARHRLKHATVEMQ